MDNKVLLVKAITLLYRESQLEDTARSSGLVKNLLEYIKLPDLNVTLDKETETVHNLKKTLMNMLGDPPGHVYDPTDLLQQIKVICGEGAQSIYDALRDGILAEHNEPTLKRQVVNLKRGLMNFIREEELKKLVSQAAAGIRFNRDDIDDLQSWVQDLVTKLEPFQLEYNQKDPAIVSHVSFSKPETLNEVFRSIKKEAEGVAILRCGWQGINRMVQGGFRRGEQWVVGALQHNYKTGFTLNIFRQFAMYNKPVMRDPAKKPLLLHISFENEMIVNMRFLYRVLKEMETRQKVTDEELVELAEEDMSKYVIDSLKVNGYEIEMLRVDPTQWSYVHLCNLMMQYEADGYEIHGCVVDYLKMMPTTGCTQGATGHDVRDMYRRMRNFTSPRGVLFMTPHQLSTQAKNLIRQDFPPEKFVKELPGKGFYDSCGSLENEVDGEIYIHKVVEDGRSWLTCQRGKHRLDTMIEDEKFLYTVLPFQKIIGIEDDINGQDTSRFRVGGGAVGSDEPEHAWWDFES